MNYENKPMTGALFKADKRNEKAPDYTGPFYGPDGEELEISAWVRKSKAGKQYMSVQVTEKWVPRAAKPAQEERFDEDVPF